MNEETVKMYEPKNIPIRDNSRRKVELDKQSFDAFGGVIEGKRRFSFGKFFVTILLLLILAIAGGCGFFYYKMELKAYQPDTFAKQTIREGSSAFGIVEHEIDGHDCLVFYGNGPAREHHRGLVFYPGGAVDYQAYAPLLNELRDSFSVIVVPKMPMQFAWFGRNYADAIRREYKGMDEWYMAGHSFGGLIAANYVAGHEKEYRGLILLASYSMKDLSDSGLKVLSICGDADEVISQERFASARKNLPSDAAVEILKGANHGQFGSYGKQAGDGKASIRAGEQRKQTAELIRQFLDENDGTEE
jgi:hypothetical protein